MSSEPKPAAVDSVRRRQRRRGTRPWPFFLHSFFGLHLSLFFGFVCLTGTIATVSYEIEWLFSPKVRASVDAPPVSWGAQWDAAQTAYAQAILRGIGKPSSGTEKYLATVVRATNAAGKSMDIYVDSGNGRVTGHSIGTTFPSLMRGLHYYLLAPTDIPFYAVTALGVVMLLSLVTGLIVYKKFWRGFLKWPRQPVGSRAWWGEVHRLIGLWSLWFVLVIGMTTVWYLLEWELVELEPPLPTVPLVNIGRLQSVNGSDIDRWHSIAQRELPGLQTTYIWLPFELGNPLQVQGQWQAWLVRERTNAVFIDPATDEVVTVRRAGDMGLGERWVHTADPLHFGDFGGLWTKLIWVLFGLALTLLALSGALIFAKRTVKAAMRLARHRPVGMAPAATREVP